MVRDDPFITAVFWGIHERIPWSKEQGILSRVTGNAVPGTGTASRNNSECYLHDQGSALRGESLGFKFTRKTASLMRAAAVANKKIASERAETATNVPLLYLSVFNLSPFRFRADN